MRGTCQHHRVACERGVMFHDNLGTIVISDALDTQVDHGFDGVKILKQFLCSVTAVKHVSEQAKIVSQLIVYVEIKGENVNANGG